MLLLDTDHFSVLTDARHARHSTLIERLLQSTEVTSIPIISVEEQMRAWIAQIHRIRDVQKQIYPYDRLIHLFEILGQWEIARWSGPAADQFTRLRKARIRIGTLDLKIAAIAIANDATLLTANLRDFEQVPDVRLENWL